MVSTIEITSPCVRNCCLDQQDVCIGCFRTLQQIMDWTSLDESQKLDVIKECEQRRLEKTQNTCQS